MSLPQKYAETNFIFMLGALKLLFRHFAQRQEVLQSFKQVITTELFYPYDDE